MACDWEESEKVDKLRQIRVSNGLGLVVAWERLCKWEIEIYDSYHTYSLNPQPFKFSINVNNVRMLKRVLEMVDNGK